MANGLFAFLLDKRNRWQWWFWLIVLVMAPLTTYLEGEGSLTAAFVYRAVGMVGKMAAGYFIAYFLLPEVLFKKRYLLLLASIIPIIFIFTVLARTLNIHVAERIMEPGGDKENLWEIISQWKYTMMFYFHRVFIFALWFAFVKIGVDYLRGQEQMARLREEKAAAELSLLKAQIHPHFLFNTLNNLYTLTLEKSDQAPEVVERLSGMLDYQLYQCNTPKVRVQQEVDLIENYLNLESLRYGKRLDLTFNNHVDDPSAKVAPLILISPVENAFKHGASGNTDRPAIDVELTVQDGTLTLRVWNNKPSTPPQDDDQYTEGIGLSNVRQQLDLLYPNRHKLMVEDGKDDFEVTITIDLHN